MHLGPIWDQISQTTFRGDLSWYVVSLLKDGLLSWHLLCNQQYVFSHVKQHQIKLRHNKTLFWILFCLLHAISVCMTGFKWLSTSFFELFWFFNKTDFYFLGHFSSLIFLLGKLPQSKLNTACGAGFCVLYIWVKFSLRCNFSCFPYLQLFLKVLELALSTVSEKLEESIKINNRCIKHLGQLCTVFLLLCFSGWLGKFLLPPAGVYPCLFACRVGGVRCDHRWWLETHVNARWERTCSELSACGRITPDGFLNPGRNRNIETSGG